jgi:bifunctional non-homologous end joining protein LigD
MAAREELVVGGVRITHPGRVLYPDAGVTKGDLARYWEAVAAAALPLLADRPLTLVRCPGGVQKPCFFQRHGGKGTPAAVPRVTLPAGMGRAQRAPYVYVDDLGALLALVQIGVVEFHAWNARVDRLDRPDTIVMDLDPGPDVPWSWVREAARTLRDLLLELGLPSWLRATGGKGLHLVAPIARRTGWDDVSAFARGLSELMARAAPERFVATASKKARAGRIYVDYLRNAAFASAIGTFSPRARPEATVAIPLGWEELDELSGPRLMTVAEAGAVDWAARDPWRGYGAGAPTLTRAMLNEVGAR